MGSRPPTIRGRRVLVPRLTAFAFVVLRDERRAQPGRAHMAPEKDQRLGATLRTLPGFADCPDSVERVTDGEIHQTIRRTRFHPTNIIDAAASHRRRRTYHGLRESFSRRPPRGRARRSASSLMRLSSSLMRRAYHRFSHRKLNKPAGSPRVEVDGKKNWPPPCPLNGAGMKVVNAMAARSA